MAYTVHHGGEEMPYDLWVGPRAFESAQDAWRALEERGSRHVFQTYELARIWLATIGRESGALPVLAAYRQDDEVVALFPACTVREGPVRLLGWLGTPHGFDYGDVLFDAERAEITADEFVTSALALIRRRSRGALLYLTNVREDAFAHPALARRLRAYKVSTAPYVPIAGEFGSYAAGLSRNTRRDIERRSRRLEEIGEVRFRMLDGSDPAIDDVMDTLLEFREQRHGATRRVSGAHTAGYLAFRREQARREGHSLVGVLSVADRIAAAQLLCVYRGRAYLLISAFDDRLAHVSPGKLLDYHVIQECFDRGLQTCDFCWGDEAHKYQWTDRETKLTTFVSDDIAGALLVSAARVRRRLFGRQAHPAASAATVLRGDAG